MKRVILTHPINASQMKAELAFFVAYFRRCGYEHCEALFGSAWANAYYPGPEWPPVRLSLEHLVAEVERVETEGFGQLGYDDLFLSVPPLALEFRFCNDSDIHIDFDEPSEITEAFYQRWKTCGYMPAEWAKDQGGKPRERLRTD